MRIRVPASTSNLGPGFDSLGLALALYLTVDVEETPGPSGVFVFQGEGADELSAAGEENLILRAMKFAASREECDLRPTRIKVRNEIPLARGLGSSGAAIIAGLSAFELIAGVRLSRDKLLRYATEIEGHSDNVAAALLGSFVVSCVSEQAEVLAAAIPWPDAVRAVAVIPDYRVRTEDARRVLPTAVPLDAAVFNVQRTSLFTAAIASGRLELLREAMRDRLHQAYRAPLAPGLREVLDLDAGELGSIPGHLGIALSGSGPTVVALATGNFASIANVVMREFESCGTASAYRVLSVDTRGRTVEAETQEA
ncbi:MAG TPA: homoserine kinase [Blastocatellia bacterium]|nr:homoserine kinase [Blastocatellia bacterium]